MDILATIELPYLTRVSGGSLTQVSVPMNTPALNTLVLSTKVDKTATHPSNRKRNVALTSSLGQDESSRL